MGEMESKKHYSIWTLPRDQWRDPLEGIDIPKKIDKRDLEKIQKQYQEKIKDRLKAFSLGGKDG